MRFWGEVPCGLQQRHIDDLCALRDVLLGLGHWRGPGLLSDTMRRELLWNGLHSVHEVLHDLGHGHAHNLLDDFFQSCDSLDQRGRFCPANDADASANVGGRDRSASSCMP